MPGQGEGDAVIGGVGVHMVRLAAEKVEAGNNCHSPFRLGTGKWWWLGVGGGVNH